MELRGGAITADGSTFTDSGWGISERLTATADAGNPLSPFSRNPTVLQAEDIGVTGGVGGGAGGTIILHVTLLNLSKGAVISANGGPGSPIGGGGGGGGKIFLGWQNMDRTVGDQYVERFTSVERFRRVVRTR